MSKAVVYKKFVGFIEKLLFCFSAILIITLAVIVSAEVIARNLFSYSFKIVEEIRLILLCWCGFFSAAYAFKRKAHISVDYFFGKFSMNSRKILFLICYLSGIIFMLFILYSSWQLALRQMNIPLMISRIPRGYIFWGLPMGSIFIIFFMINEVIESFFFGQKESFLTAEEIYANNLETVQE